MGTTEEEEMLSAYQLKTLNPRSWDDAVDNAAVAGFTYHDSDDAEDRGYEMLLEFVNRDFNPNVKPVDPLNPDTLIGEKLHNISKDDAPKFNIASKSFNSKQFLKLIHDRSSFEELRQGLQTLDSSISRRNRELKDLIEREALKFVKSKSALDAILLQFQKSGFSDEDSGLKEVRASVNDAAKEGTLLVKPILANKQKEMRLKQSLEYIQKNKSFFDLPKQLRTYIQEQDYDSFIHDYKQAKVMREADNSKVVSRIWEEVEEITDVSKQRLWSSLSQTDSSDAFLKSIKKLMELDTIDNPILEWIDVKSKTHIVSFIETFGCYREKILNIQLNILSTLSHPEMGNFMASLGSNVHLVDSTIVIEMWLMLNKMQEELREKAEEFVSFWTHVQNFINGSYFPKLQSNFINPDSPYLRLEDYEIEEIRAKGAQYIDQYVNKISLLFNSTQNTLNSDTKILAGDGTIASFGFIPPFSNSLSTLKYLPPIAGALYDTLNKLGQLAITDNSVKSLRELSVDLNERIVSGMCASWLNDCHNFYRLEDWTKESTGETALPGTIFAFETYVIERLGDLLFARLPEGKDVQIVKYPSKKILTGIQIQFLRSFDVLLESMIKKVIEENQNTSVSRQAKNHHKLLTLFNIKKMSERVVPSLLEKYDEVFETTLRTQKLEIYSILQKMESTIFDSYMTEQKKAISQTAHDGMQSVDWASYNEMPRKVSAYVFQTLTLLITVHTGVLSVSSELIGKVLRDLIEYVSASLLKGFRSISIFSTDAIAQVVLDVEFFKSVVGKSATSVTQTNLKLIYKTIITSGVSLGSILDANSEVLSDAMAGSSIDRDIFSTA